MKTFTKNATLQFFRNVAGILNESEAQYPPPKGGVVVNDTNRAQVMKHFPHCCLAPDNRNGERMWDFYTKRGPLYHYVRGGKHYLYHPATSTLVDEQDRQLRGDEYSNFFKSK